MVIKISKNRILENVKFRRFIRPTNYTIITLFISIYFLNGLNYTLIEGVEIRHISIGFTILITITYYLGYYYPRNSSRRVIFLLVSSVFILIDVCLVSLIAIIEIKIEGVSTVIIDLRPLFVPPIILLSLNVFKKVIDMYEFKKNQKI